MENRKMKRIVNITALSLLMIFSGAQLFSRTVVFPFKVNSSENKAHQWLGRSISLYLTYGFKINNIDTFSDNESRGLLKSLNIKFPYNVSKASIVTAAGIIRADKIIWGEITTLPGSTGEETVSIRTFLINTNNFNQHYLPVVKGELVNLFKIQESLLDKVLKFSKFDSTPKFPKIKFNLRNYETFIKGLLIDDNDKKGVFLKSLISERGDNPGMLLFELARVYFLKNDYESAKKFLDEIDPKNPFIGEKYFLSGIINYLTNNFDDSFSDFSKVLECGECRYEALNNIALIYALKNEYEKALEAINESVKLGFMANSYLNAVNISILLKNNNSALRFLKEGLSIYPSDEDLITLFFHFIGMSPEKEYLKSVFSKYLPEFSPESGDRKMFFKLINPFVFSGNNYNPVSPTTDKNSLNIGNSEEYDKDDIERALIRNPFKYEGHFMMSILYYKKGNPEIGERYGKAALFIKKNPDNYLIVLKCLRRLGKRDELKKTLIEALKYFPDNEKIQKFSLNNN